MASELAQQLGPYAGVKWSQTRLDDGRVAWQNPNKFLEDGVTHSETYFLDTDDVMVGFRIGDGRMALLPVTFAHARKATRYMIRKFKKDNSTPIFLISNKLSVEDWGGLQKVP